MVKAIFVVTILMACVAVSTGFGIREILDYVLGGTGYGNYYPGGPGYYPSGPGQYPSGPGHYPSGPGHYPGGSNYGPPGPPGAHPGCPLCDSSVYSYCSHKEAHDGCCCSGSYGYGCRKSDCSFLYANTCEEFQLISKCCCVDLHKNAVVSPVIAPVV